MGKKDILLKESFTPERFADAFNAVFFNGQKIVDPAKIDLGEVQEISNLSFNCNLTKGDWIFNAKSVKVLVSDNGEDYKEIYSQEFPIETVREDGVMLYNIDFNKVSTQYVNVIIEPFMCPEGHSGYGYPAWIFIDELSIN